MSSPIQVHGDPVPSDNPLRWDAAKLVTLSWLVLDQLARQANGCLTATRLLLGRCLLALERSRGYLDFGCSSVIHYANERLKLSKRTARLMRWVATLASFI